MGGMLNETAAKLKPGDVVLTKVRTKGGSEVMRVVVRRVRYGPYKGVIVTVRLPHPSKSGRPVSVNRFAHELDRLPVGRDPLSANIYADWLEENGEVRAARMLRAAFPVYPAETVGEKS